VEKAGRQARQAERQFFSEFDLRQSSRMRSSASRIRLTHGFVPSFSTGHSGEFVYGGGWNQGTTGHGSIASAAERCLLLLLLLLLLPLLLLPLLASKHRWRIHTFTDGSIRKSRNSDCSSGLQMQAAFGQQETYVPNPFSVLFCFILFILFIFFSRSGWHVAHRASV